VVELVYGWKRISVSTPYVYTHRHKTPEKRRVNVRRRVPRFLCLLFTFGVVVETDRTRIRKTTTPKEKT
jgi:hypothetical protein